MSDALSDLHARLLRVQQAAASLAISHPHFGLSHLVLGVLPDVEQLMRDADRLDWLELHTRVTESSNDYRPTAQRDEQFPTLRAAIDASQTVRDR